MSEEKVEVGGIAADRLRSLVERIEHLEEEKKALSGVKFEDVIKYLDAVDSAEKLGVLSEAFYSDISCGLYGDKKREVLECFRRNNKRLGGDLGEFLKTMEEDPK